MKYWNLAIRAITVLILISVSVVTCKIAFLSLSLDVSPINKSIVGLGIASTVTTPTEMTAYYLLSSLR
jgi:hypothetical protein